MSDGAVDSQVGDVHRFIDELGPGSVVAIGGYFEQNVPMGLLRLLAERSIKELTVVAAPSASIGVDFLVSAGCVGEIVCPYVGFEERGPAVATRREVSAGTVRRRPCDQEILCAGLRAAAQRVPFVPILTTDSDVMRDSPDVARVCCPFTGEDQEVARALTIDLALLHAQAADRNRSLGYAGSRFMDLMFATAARNTIATVDSWSRAESGQWPSGSVIAGIWIDAVTELSAWPAASQGRYPADGAAIDSYIAAEKNVPGSGSTSLAAPGERASRATTPGGPA
ncbi:CoA-transferase [Streptomyces sp. NPDC047081]|uniref:CoA-transferase n=1 Tax=Streptomyces sp. NPDC047081 TaxID=3154706 RepID=UPI0033D43BBD